MDKSGANYAGLANINLLRSPWLAAVANPLKNTPCLPIYAPKTGKLQFYKYQCILKMWHIDARQIIATSNYKALNFKQKNL